MNEWLNEQKDTRRAAQEEGDYAHAFWLCVQSGQAMGALGALRCAQPLAESVNALYEETIDRLESALQACCTDFKPDTLGKASACMFAVHMHTERALTMNLKLCSTK